MRNLFLVLTALSAAGCIPIRYQSRPAETLKVLDQDSHEPIPGARVLVETWGEGGPCRGRNQFKLGQFEGSTDKDGLIQVPRQKNWSAIMLGACPSCHDSRICIDKQGYELFEFDPWKSKETNFGGKYPGADFNGVFLLKPSQSSRKAGCFSGK
jgi:hypothetical protein